MSNPSNDDFGKKLSNLLAFALIALYSALALFAYAINVTSGLHGLFCVIIFLSTSYMMAKYVPFKWQVGVGTLIMTGFIFGILTALKADKIWSTFGAGLYLALSFYSLKSVGSLEELLQSLPERKPKNGHAKSSSLDQASAPSMSVVNSNFIESVDHIKIQIDRGMGSWVTVSTVVRNNSQMIAHSMKQVQKIHSGKRIRAIDKDGRLVDML